MTVFWRLVLAGAVMGVLDGAWLSTVGRRFYIPILQTIRRNGYDTVAAGAFYVLYVIGVVFLAVAPSDNAGEAALRGLLLGAVAYGTYDLTNRATIQPFPWRLALLDIAWGTALTAVAATVSKAIAG